MAIEYVDGGNQGEIIAEEMTDGAESLERPCSK